MACYTQGHAAVCVAIGCWAATEPFSGSCVPSCRQCGVTLSWLQRFGEAVDEGMTTEEVVQRIIIPETAELNCR